MRKKEFGSVNEFLDFNKNVILFAEFIQAEDLLNKITDLILTFHIYDFIAFWNDLKSIFTMTYENGNIVIFDLQLRNFSTKLLEAERAKRNSISNFILKFSPFMRELETE